jgi:surfeit locus 1 family protein
MYRFLLSRRWLAVLLLLIVFVVVCTELGLWQLRRLDQRTRVNAIISTNLHLPAVPVSAAFASGDINAALYRHVSARGTYDVSQEVLLTGRALNDRPGTDALTPLVTEDGRALIVNRGFLPFGIDKPGDPRAKPTGGTVTVTGILLRSEGRGLFGQAIPPAGRVDTIPRIDVPRIGRQVPYAVFPAYLLLDSQQPPQPGTVPQHEQYLPDLSNGPHLSYAIQWFSFAALAVIAYVGMAWRRARVGAPATTLEPRQPA